MEEEREFTRGWDICRWEWSRGGRREVLEGIRVGYEYV
jgi:hypothetical protein